SSFLYPVFSLFTFRRHPASPLFPYTTLFRSMESAGVLVFQERRWFAGVEQQDVDVAIVEDIAKGRAPARVKRKCGKARFLADLVKSAVAIVAMEEQRLLEAGTGVQRIDLRIDMAIGDENVEPGIVVHVKE